MRTQASILAIALGCALVAVTALVAEHGSTRATTVDRPRPAGAALVERDERPLPAVAEQLTAPESGLAPAELVSRQPSQDETRRPSSPSTLDDELQRARELGLVDDLRLAEFLARLEVERGQPRRALELLREYESKDPDVWWLVVQEFMHAADPVGLREAVLAALEVQPDDEGLMELLIQVDPGLAVSRLQLQLALASPEDQGEARARLAAALVGSERLTEARLLIDAMLAEQADDDRAIQLLSAVDPALAMAHVERLMPSDSSPEDLRRTLIDLWTGMGNVAGAESLLDRLSNEGQTIGPEEWGQVAEAWMNTGQNERARAAFLRALAEEQGDPDEWVHALADLAPAELLTALERRVARDASNNDEYWGSLADAYWAAGRPADARSAWERARALDQDDEEWPRRLQAFDEGEDPFGD